MPTVAELIQRRHDWIVDAWAGQATTVAWARGLDRPELLNLLPVYLDTLRHSQAKSSERIRALEEHLSTRLRQGVHIGEIVEEIVLLGRCIVSSWAEIPESGQPHPADVSELLAEIQRDCARVTDLFARHMLEEEQTEKRYLRLLEVAAAEHRATGTPLTRLHDELLALVVEGMGAQTSALVLLAPEDERLYVAASVGLANELLREHVTSLSSRSLGDDVAEARRSLEASDAAPTRFEVSETLRRSGIHALLGTRLPPRNQFLGMLYVGLSESRDFTPSEARRMDVLCERVAIILEAETLSDRLRATIARLEREKAMREQFVSLLAHDLRGPLSTARLAAQLLIAQPAVARVREEMPARILRNLDRTDRMVRDLLDANRIRAGEPLALELVSTDLREIAEQVTAELTEAHGPRFRLVAPEPVRARWDPEQLRRAMWNLGANAAKYGSADGIVTLRIERRGDRVRASVHNTGAPIPSEAQALLFEPFARIGGDRRGWGLGLTLVRGCAEAHGGRAWVESTPEKGTTFTLELPLRS